MNRYMAFSLCSLGLALAAGAQPFPETQKIIRERSAIRFVSKQMNVPVEGLAVMVVQWRDRGRGGAQQQIEVAEEREPREPHAVARLVGGQPVAVREHGRARGARVVALVLGLQGPRGGEVLLEVGVGLAIVLLIYRNRRSVDLTGIDALKG